jgi:hypothetical protein
MKDAEKRRLNCFAELHLPLHYVTSSGFIMFRILQGWAEVLQDDGDINWRF